MTFETSDPMPPPPANGAPKGTRPGFAVVDAAAIFAPLEEPSYVIARVAPRSSIVLLAAYGSSSKTWQGIDACVSVAAGLPWLGRFPTERGPTAFVDFESGSYEVRRRIQAVARGRGFDKVEGVAFVTMPGLYLGDEKFFIAMEQLATGRKLVVLDSLRAASLLDENDSRIRVGLDRLRVIGERTGCAFMVLVHSKKTTGAPGHVDEREQLRGSSAIFDAADVVLLSAYRKADERFDVAQVKARIGRKVDPFSVRLSDENGGVIVAAEDLAEEKKPAKGDPWDEKTAKAVEAITSEPGISQTKLRVRIGGNAKAADAVVQALVDAGRVVDLQTMRGNRVDHSYRIRPAV